MKRSPKDDFLDPPKSSPHVVSTSSIADAFKDEDATSISTSFIADNFNDEDATSVTVSSAIDDLRSFLAGSPPSCPPSDYLAEEDALNSSADLTVTKVQAAAEDSKDLNLVKLSFEGEPSKPL